MKKRLLLVFTCLTASSVCAKGGWVTDQENQCQIWDSDPKTNQLISWSGECKNGKANGKGIASWYEGNNVVTTIQGIMKDGLCKEECLVTVISGKNQFKYAGQLKDNELHGKGVFTWPDGNEYSGDWVEGKRNGTGKFIWKNGAEYLGDWKDDKSTGKGTYIWKDRDEEKYTGEVEEDKFHGKGVMYYTNGDKYSGSWANGKRHGRGIYTFKDGTTYKGIWENGERIWLVPRLRDLIFWQ